MQSDTPHRHRLLSAAISLSLLLLATQPLAQQTGVVEEIVVTGTYIRRSEGFQQASQITQLSADDLVNQGTLNIGEIIQNLSFVNGPDSAITNTIQGTDSRSTTIDLRGLGSRSTLTLVDGKRLANQNVNALIPTIAIQRMDIVADGATALYGSEAVAGVVNFIPYTSYDGFKLDSYAEQDERGDYDEHSVQMLWGGQIGGLDLVLAGQFRQSGRLEWAERSKLAQSGLTMSSNAPGNWFVPERDENGQYTGNFQPQVEPSCGSREALKPGVATTRFGALLKGNEEFPDNCFHEYGDNRSYRDPIHTNQFFANATYDVNDDLTLRGQLFTTRLHEVTYSSTSNPGDTLQRDRLPAVRGEIPGNPFRALDANGNVLFGVDADKNGIPDRQPGVDLNTDGWDDYVVSGTTPNGVPLYEDIRVRTLRPINKTMAYGTTGIVLPGHTTDMDNKAGNTDRLSRWFVQADFTVPFMEGWVGQTSYTSNYRENDSLDNQTYDISAMIQGLNCDVANDRDACYSPFFVTDPSNATSVHVLNDIAARDRTQMRDELDVIDIIFTGDLPLGGFELPGGPIGVAFGYQFRDDSFTITPSQVFLAGDGFINYSDNPIVGRGDREIDAYFAEFAIPLLFNLELEVAARREEFSTGQKSTDPKFGLTWVVTDWLSLRATKGDAFIAATLQQLLQPGFCGGLASVADRFTAFNSFVIECGAGNPNLNNETSENQQFGFDLNIGDFELSVSWSNTDFKNRIVNTTAQTIMNFDFENFKVWSGFTGDGLTAETQPSLTLLQAWLNSGRSDPRIERDSNDPRTIVSIEREFINAETVEVTAWDIQGNYSLSTNWGDFLFGLQATHVQEFLYQENLLQPVIDGAGKFNDSTGAAPNLPDWKANLRISWNRGNHYINTITRYYSNMPYDGPTFPVIGLFDNTNYPLRIIGGDVNAWTQVDGSYTYRGIEMFGGAAAITFGMRNMFDREAQRSPLFAGVIGQLQDPMGRTFYARFVYDF